MPHSTPPKKCLFAGLLGRGDRCRAKLSTSLAPKWFGCRAMRPHTQLVLRKNYNRCIDGAREGGGGKGRGGKPQSGEATAAAGREKQCI